MKKIEDQKMHTEEEQHDENEIQGKNKNLHRAIRLEEGGQASGGWGFYQWGFDGIAEGKIDAKAKEKKAKVQSKKRKAKSVHTKFEHHLVAGRGGSRGKYVNDVEGAKGGFLAARVFGGGTQSPKKKERTVKAKWSTINSSKGGWKKLRTREEGQIKLKKVAQKIPGAGVAKTFSKGLGHIGKGSLNFACRKNSLTTVAL